MTAPDECPEDWVPLIIAKYSEALRKTFDPDSRCPPVEGSKVVRFVAGEGPADVLFDLHKASTKNCAEPLLHIRLANRYRVKISGDIAAPMVDKENKCTDLPEAIEIEIGITRCSVAIDERPKWDRFEREAQMSLDDSHRLKLAQCWAASQLRAAHHEVGNAIIRPHGPDGGVVGWVTTVYVKQASR